MTQSMERGLRLSRFVEKPWGREEIWAECDTYLGKIITINPNCRLSRQYHVTKEETIRVLKGSLRLEVGQNENIETRILNAGECFHVTPGTIHRFCCEGDSQVDLLEVSTSHLHDVVRLEDDYNR